jgi:parallel beta-helix repeat protein
VVYFFFAEPTMTGCTIAGNSGSGIESVVSYPTILRCIISGNSGRGLSFNPFCMATVTSSIVSENSGGGIFFRLDDGTTITNCTISGNSAIVGGGIYFWEDSSPTIRNCILWDNTATSGPEIAIDTPDPFYVGAPSISRCAVKGGQAAAYVGDGCTLDWGGGILTDDPLFVDADGPDEDPYTWVDNDHHLLPDSPCINAGDPNFVPDPNETDIDGDDRVQHCRVDMGADETPYIGPDCNQNGTADACDLEGGIGLDCNHNYIPDECEPGDIDGDGDVDLNDFATFALCFYGPNITVPPAGCSADERCMADADGDNDVDLDDFNTFALSYTG